MRYAKAMKAKSWMIGGLAVFLVALFGWIQSRQGMQEWNAEQEAATAKYNEFADTLIERRRDYEAQAQVQAESTTRTREWAAAQEQAYSDIRGINDAKAREYELLLEKQAAEEEIAKARNAREMAEIGVFAE